MAKKTAAVRPVVIRPGVEIYKGDCLKVLAQLDEGCAEMVFTDPPYGHNDGDGDLKGIRALAGLPNARGRPLQTLLNDGPEANEIFRAALPLMRRVLNSGCCCCCCCCGGGPDPQFARWSLWLDEVFRFKQMVVWDKGPMGMGWHYRRSYETVLVAEVPGKCRWYGHKRVENIIRPGQYGIRKVIPTDDQHPTEKPPELAKAFIVWHSKRGDTVVDPFMGAGSTGLAAMRLGRRFIGIELDPKWFDKAREKLYKEVGNP
jgi:DNA modification methylase